MANSVTTQVILDGARNAIIKIEGVLDTSDLASTVIADVSQLTGIDNTLSRKAANFRVGRVSYDAEGALAVILSWDGTTPSRIGSFDGCDNVSYEAFGGLTNNAVGPNGKITARTQGYAALTSSTFILVIELIKTGA
jgi:hypothetical protein